MAKVFELQSEQAGLRADRERLAAVQQGKDGGRKGVFVFFVTERECRSGLR